MATTSAEAYEAALASGLITGLRAKVLKDLATNGPSTARAIFERTGIFPGSITPRLAELESMGVVTRAGTTGPSPVGTDSVLWTFVPGPPRPLTGKRRGKSMREKFDIYEKALNQIASARCNCPNGLLFGDHMPGCPSSDVFFGIAVRALAEARA